MQEGTRQDIPNDPQPTTTVPNGGEEESKGAGGESPVQKVIRRQKLDRLKMLFIGVGTELPKGQTIVAFKIGTQLGGSLDAGFVIPLDPQEEGWQDIIRESVMKSLDMIFEQYRKNAKPEQSGIIVKS